MSGGGGGGGDGWPPPPDDVDCNSLQFENTLRSPQPEPVAELQVGSQLDVLLEAEGDITRIAARRQGDGALVGVFAGDRMAELLRCLQQNVAFVAEVSELDGGLVRVRVRPVQ